MIFHNRDIVRDALEQAKLPDEVISALVEACRPYRIFVPVKSGREIPDTRYDAGSPPVPEGFVWPQAIENTDRELVYDESDLAGRPLWFLGQMRLDGDDARKLDLPFSGNLHFYSIAERDWDNYAIDLRDDWKVLYLPEGTPVTKAELPVIDPELVSRSEEGMPNLDWNKCPLFDKTDF